MEKQLTFKTKKADDIKYLLSLAFFYSFYFLRAPYLYYLYISKSGRLLNPGGNSFIKVFLKDNSRKDLNLTNHFGIFFIFVSHK